MRFTQCVLLVATLLTSFFSFATDRVSTGTGNWATSGTWSPSGVPVSGDNVTILAGHTVSMNSNPGSCNNITVNGTFGCNTSRTLNAAGSLLLNNGAVITGGTGALNIAGTFSVPLGASASINRVTLTVTGTTTINGTLTFTNTGGSKTFSDVIITSTGIWTASAPEAITINGNVTAASTFSCNSGTYAVSGSFSATAGTTNFEGTIGTTLTVASGATFNANTGNLSVGGAVSISGTINFSTTTGVKSFADITVNSGGVWNCSIMESVSISGNITCNGTFASNTGTYTLSGAGKTISGTTLSISNVNISGSYTNNGTFAAGTALSGTGSLTQGANGTLKIGGTSGIITLAASAIPNTVIYSSASAQTIRAITYYNLQVSKTGGSVGTFGGTTTISNDFTVSSGTAATGGNTISVGGTTTMDGILNISSTVGTKTFGNITVNAAGTWTCSVAEDITVNGNISNSGTFTANTGIYTLAGAGKIISGNLSIPAISITGSCTNNGTVTSTVSLGGAGTFTQGTTGILNVTTGTFTVTNFNASASGNTVNYNFAGAQSVRIPSDGAYHHLTLAGSGTKTLAGTTVVNGDLTISSTLDVSTGDFAVTLGGNWSNTGTFTPRNGTVTLNGSSAQSITRTGGETFNHLTLSGAGTKTLGSDVTASGNLTFSSTLDVSVSNFAVAVKGNWMNNGTFVYRNGTVAFSGTSAQTIGGTSTTDFYNITQANAAGVSLAQNQNLYKTLTVSSGTFTTTGFTFSLKSNAGGTANIAAIPGGANFAGNIVMERYTGTGPTDWRFLCSAVSSATIADWDDDMFTSGFTGADCAPGNCVTCGPTCSWPSIYYYDESNTGILDSGFVGVNNVTNAITPGKGYEVYLGPNPVTYEVTGAPNKFTQAPSVSYTNTGISSDDGWNLVANPYPSAIDWGSANWTKANLDDAIYIYNASTGSFASYVGGMGVNGGTQYVASQQAFWVKANTGGPVLGMLEDVKVSTDPAYMKSVQTPNTSHYPVAFRDFPVPQNTNSTPNSILLTASGNGFEDETYIRFSPGASDGFDSNYDAWKMASLNYASPNLSSVINDSLDLSINSFPALTSDRVIPLRLTVPSSGTYTIRRDSVLMLPMSTCIFLEDLANGNMIDLRSVISYSFTIADTTAAPRFLLHIAAPVSKQSFPVSCANDSTGMAIALGTGTGPWDYVWKDAAGTILQISLSSFSADTLFNQPAGIYTIEVSGSLCGTVTDTIEIKSTSTLAAMINYSDVTCFGLNDGSAYTTVAGGSAPFTYLWSNGSTASQVSNLTAQIYSVTVTDAGGCSRTEFVSISQPAILTAGFAGPDTVDLSVTNTASFTNSSSGASSYYWDFGDGSPSDTALAPLHFYSLAGTYTVMLIASNNSCSDTSYAVVEVINGTATGFANGIASSSVNVLYEEGGIWLSFDLPAKKDVSISVYNSLGEKIIFRDAKQIQKGRIRLEMQSLSAGIYIVVAGLDNTTVSRKILLPIPSR